MSGDTKKKIENSQPNYKKHVFIIGSKGIPAKYGGFETFVENLTLYQKTSDIQYHVSCMTNSKESGAVQKMFTHNGAECVNFSVKDIGAAKAITYDIQALNYFIDYAKKNKLNRPIFYILACRIGPFISYYKNQITKMGGKLYVNPDGHEWKRDKWIAPIRKYWKLSERLMVKNADLLVCDSKNIEKYIHKEYEKYKPNTTFIAYGAHIRKSVLSDDNLKVINWYRERGINPREYYLIVGRLVPENNYETMIKEYMKSSTSKDLILITEIKDSLYYNKLKEKTGFENDSRIKFVGTVYDQELLKKIREDAYGYLHGHEVGGTNPSLLEALASTDLNLLIDVGFNREVAEKGALYWSKEDMNLASLITTADATSFENRELMKKIAKTRIIDWYSWDYIVNEYEVLFNTQNNV